MPAILIRPLRQIRQVCRSVMLFSTFLLITLFCADEADEAGVSAELLAWYKARDGESKGKGKGKGKERSPLERAQLKVAVEAEVETHRNELLGIARK